MRSDRLGDLGSGVSGVEVVGVRDDLLTRLAAHVRLLLVAYGVLVASVGVLVFAGTPGRSLALEGSRQIAIRGAISVLNQGGPPLLQGNGQAAEAGDDPGIYLYLSFLGRTLGSSDPRHLLKWFFIGLFAILLAVYPLLWFELLSSLAAAFLAPILVILQFRFLAIVDVYWIPAWCVLLGIPLIMLVYQRWGTKSLMLLVGVMVVGSFSSSIRAQAGLPLLLAAVIVVLLRVPSWRARACSVAVLAAAYMTVTGFAFPAIRHYRDQSIGVPLSAKYTASHVFWHPAYLGLGYLPNRFGISWNDSVAIEAARKVNPRAVYPSTQYERTVRHLYFNVVRKDPGFVIHVYLAKAVVVASDAFRRFWTGILFLPAMLLIGSRLRKRMRILVALVLPAALLGALPPLLGVPTTGIELGWLGAWALVWLSVMLWLAAVVPWSQLAVAALNWGSAILRCVRFRTHLALAEARATNSGVLRTPVSLARNDRATRWSVGIVIGACALGLGLGHLADSVRAESAYQIGLLRNAELARVPVRHGATLRTWAFARQLARWSVVQGVRTRRHQGLLDVATNDERYGYQIVSPVLDLHPGAYGVLVHGEVRAGGLGLEVLDVARQRFVVENLYSAQQRDSPTNFHNGRMFAAFALASDTKIQLVLSNWAPAAKSSHWRLSSASLVRQKRPCGCSPPDDNAWISK